MAARSRTSMKSPNAQTTDMISPTRANMVKRKTVITESGSKRVIDMPN